MREKEKKSCRLRITVLVIGKLYIASTLELESYITGKRVGLQCFVVQANELRSLCPPLPFPAASAYPAETRFSLRRATRYPCVIENECN